MEPRPVISKITIYPVKSLDGVSLQRARVSKGGCLRHDREFAMIDSDGRYINGKSNSLVHALRCAIDFDTETISFKHQNESSWQRFHLEDEKGEIDKYLSVFFSTKTTLVKNTEGRFMDIPGIAGITLLSAESLRSVSGWYNAMELEETRRRFRATLEIEGVPAFWEDKLFCETGEAVEFITGGVRILGISPRARCVVPTRHPENGNVIHGFPKIFSRNRLALLPHWSALEKFGHTYYLTVNCLIPETEIDKWIEVGNTLELTGNKIQL